jgi:ubiquinone/menaquinone biosynthesis C-methylase UbiE
MTAENTYKRKSRTYFDASAANYDQASDMGIHPPLLAGLLAQLAKLPHPNSILDVGCGTGTLLFRLQAQTNATLAGLDISTQMLALARQKLGAAVDLRQGDSENLPWETHCFDLVCCTFSFHHYPQPDRALAEMRRVLKPGGALLLADITFPGFVRPFVNLILPLLSTGDRHFYSRAEMLRLLEHARFQAFTWQKINASTFLVSACVP